MLNIKSPKDIVLSFDGKFPKDVTSLGCEPEKFLYEACSFRLAEGCIDFQIEQKTLRDFKNKTGRDYKRVTDVFKEFGVPDKIADDFLAFGSILYLNLYYQGIKDGVKIAFELLNTHFR